MICITISQESRRMALVDMLNAAMLGADLIEVRLDRFEKDANLTELMSAKKKPIIFSCKRPQDGGQWEGTEEERAILLRAAVMAKADYVDIELDAADSIRPFPTYKRVISYTNLETTPRDIAEIYAEMQTKKPDVIKLTCKANTPEEAWPLILILNKPPVPTVVVGLGPLGVMLSLLGRKIGAPWATASLEKGMEAYPGQATVRELDEFYRYRDIGKPTRFIGVTGQSERQKLLAGLLNTAFAMLELPHRVLPLEVGNLKMFRKIIDGVRLQAVVLDDSANEGLHEIATYDDSAKLPIASADTLFPVDGGWKASNLLGQTVANALNALLIERGNPDGLKGRSVMLAGVGPLTKMMVTALKAAGASLLWASKDKTAVAQAAATFGGRQLMWEAIYNTSHDVLIVGRDGAPSAEDVLADDDAVSVHPGYLKPGMCVVDLLSGLTPSPFLQEAKRRRCGIVSPRRLMIEHVRETVLRLTEQVIAVEPLNEKLLEWLGDEFAEE